jgi:hypothetical protein
MDDNSQSSHLFSMKMPSIAASAAAAAALNSLQQKDPREFQRLFQHMNHSSLSILQTRLREQWNDTTGDGQHQYQIVSLEEQEKACNRVVASAILRKIVFNVLHKHSEIVSPDQVEAALKQHTLPASLQEELVARYGGDPPHTWYEALLQLQAFVSSDANNNINDLWQLLSDHPMTSYVPMQCQSCGHVVPDDLCSGQTDAEVGITEEEPTADEAPFVRSGWFRGPRQAKVFVLTCPTCNTVSRWFRSRDLSIILNPNKWGRLCGEQEDLKLDLAAFLGISVRTCVPLDWDHIWNEFRPNNEGGDWTVCDDNARNFAVRLDEGIGSWTGVLAIHTDPELCGDVTERYLSCQDDGGVLDDKFAPVMEKYHGTVSDARKDASGEATQARTVIGYSFLKAGFNSSQITKEMKIAAMEYASGSRSWYKL